MPRLHHYTMWVTLPAYFFGDFKNEIVHFRAYFSRIFLEFQQRNFISSFNNLCYFWYCPHSHPQSLSNHCVATTVTTTTVTTKQLCDCTHSILAFFLQSRGGQTIWYKKAGGPGKTQGARPPGPPARYGPGSIPGSVGYISHVHRAYVRLLRGSLGTYGLTQKLRLKKYCIIIDYELHFDVEWFLKSIVW